MNIKSLITHWEKYAQGELTEESFSVHLCRDDAARLDALADMYPKRTKEQLLSELVSSALEEIERSFPYIAGSEIASVDEYGDPIYKDEGPTTEFLNRTRKHLARYKGAANS